MSNLDKAKALQSRTKFFAVRIIHLCEKLPKSDTLRILSRQLLRSGTSVAANYRAVCRAKSQADFVSKMNTVVEETDETLLWFELLVDAGLVKQETLSDLMSEATELLMIFSKSLHTAKNR